MSEGNKLEQRRRWKDSSVGDLQLGKGGYWSGDGGDNNSKPTIRETAREEEEKKQQQGECASVSFAP